MNITTLFPAVHEFLAAPTAQPKSAAISAPVVNRPDPTDVVTLSLGTYQVPGWYADYAPKVANQLGGFAEKYALAEAGTTAERTEYASLVQGHYRAVLAANGITDAETHYNATIQDSRISESLRRQMAERVQGDDRLVSLMKLLGVPLPS